MSLLNVRNLEVSFGGVQALRRVSFEVQKGQTLGIVGESGAGKSTIAFAIMGLIAKPGVISKGSITFDGLELTKLSAENLRQLRGDQIAMIFQDPLRTLNPALTIGDQMIEVLQAHRELSNAQAKELSIEKLKSAAVAAPAERFNSYPFQLSGGQRQRVVIAISLLCEPKLIIADSPTTALDVTAQAEIMALLSSLCKDNNMSLVLITHNLALVAQHCEHISVMYAGGIVEQGKTSDVIYAPSHPYTLGLLNALPQRNIPGEELYQIRGRMPDSLSPDTGCPFSPRCDFAVDQCCSEIPDLDGYTRKVACFNRLTY